MNMFAAEFPVGYGPQAESSKGCVVSNSVLGAGILFGRPPGCSPSPGAPPGVVAAFVGAGVGEVVGDNDGGIVHVTPP